MEWECLGTISSLNCRITPTATLEGEQLPNDAVAKSYGGRVVRELKERDFESDGAILHVRNEAGQTIQSIPFCVD